MKIVWCTLLPLAFLFPACGPGGSSDAARESGRIMQDRISMLEADLTKAANESKLNQRSLDSSRMERLKMEQQAKEERAVLQKKLDQLTKDFEDYKNKFRLTSRNRAAGQRLERLVCGGGVIYDQVEILSLTPGELRFRHASGLGKVALGRLDGELREKFGYNAAEAAAWQLAEFKKEELDENAGEKIAAPATGKVKPDRVELRAKERAHAIRRNYVITLNNLVASARNLQADQNCCPIHKREQLTAWSAQAARLRAKIAAIPNS